jgi:hypothetical protein
MKILRLFLIPLLMPCMAQADTLRVLFIGNSYTFYHNMPSLVANFAAASGDHLIQQMSAPGGMRLMDHCTNTATLAAIQQGGWDYVVLQEQSQLPSFPDNQVATDVYPYARRLDSMVRKFNPCAKSVFYMTWGRKNGDAMNCSSWPPVCTYQGMDSLLRLRYTYMAAANNSVLSPVGRVWRRLRNTTSLNLYDPDESHPSDVGAYATACAFYSLLYKKNPVGNSFNGPLSATDASTIRAAVKATVFDSLSTWHAGAKTIGGFNTSINKNTVTFTGTSVNASSWFWNFGNGQTSTQQNPIHNYTAKGTYQVTQISMRCKDRDTVRKSVVISQLTAVADPEAALQPELFPNPVSSVCTLVLPGGFSRAVVRNLSGQVVRILEGTQADRQEVNMSMLPAGLYLLECHTGKGVLRTRFIRQ